MTDQSDKPPTKRKQRSKTGRPAHPRHPTAQISDWSDIHFAYQVARLGTLSAAADVLDVHHSTVLRRIDALEKRLNTRLFHRHARGYIATDAGKLMLQVAEHTQEEFDRLMGQLAGIDLQLSGKLVITTVNSFASQITPVLAEFQKLHPEIHLEYVADSRIFKLEYGEAHVSIRPGTQPKDPDYVVQHLRTMPTTLYASASYIKQHGMMKTLRDIDGQRFISTVSPLNNISYMRWINENIPVEQIYYRASDFLTMIQAAECGMGVTPANCWIADTSRKIQRLFDPPREWDEALWLVTHRDIHRTPKVQALTQFLKDKLREQTDSVTTGQTTSTAKR